MTPAGQWQAFQSAAFEESTPPDIPLRIRTNEALLLRWWFMIWNDGVLVFASGL